MRDSSPPNPPSPGFSGHHVEWSEDKKTKFEGDFEDGKPIGVWIQWHKNPKKTGPEWRKFLRVGYEDEKIVDWYLYDLRGR